MQGVSPVVMEEFAHAYCDARTSSQGDKHELAEFMDNAFEMYDPLGLVPLLKSSDEVTDQAKATAGVVAKQLQLERLSKLLVSLISQAQCFDSTLLKSKHLKHVKEGSVLCDWFLS